MQMRVERDMLGERDVPADVYWGVHTSRAIENFPMDKINTHLDGVPYSPWEVVEHMRITQRDILDYIQSPNYIELNFPIDYWPIKGKEATE